MELQWSGYTGEQSRVRLFGSVMVQVTAEVGRGHMYQTNIDSFGTEHQDENVSLEPRERISFL